jgi:hypothetical protein
MSAHSRLERLPSRTLGLTLLGIAMVLAAALSIWWLRGITFTIDEVGYLVGRRGWNATSLLKPHNGHLVLTHLLVFKATLALFGAESHLPFTLLTVVAQLAVGGLVYELVRRRLGPLVALLPAILVLFLGAGWEVLLNPAGLSNQFALIAGLGMLLCLERRNRAGDVWACALLALALASHTLALAFAAGAIVEVLALGGRSGWRRLWLVAAPLAFYTAWALWALKFEQVQSSGYAMTSVVGGVYDQLAASATAITGIFRQPGSPDLSTQLVTVDAARGGPLVFMLIGAVGLRARVQPSPSARTWALLAIGVAYLVLVALGLRDGRPPEASRYVYTGSVLLLLVLAQLCDGLRLGRGWAIAATAIVALALVPNVAQMRSAGLFFRVESEFNRSEMAALDLGRGCIPPDYVPEETVATILPHRDLLFTAAAYYEAVDSFGSPGYSPAELAAASPEARAAAETIFDEALGRRVVVGPSPLPASVRLCR